MTYRFPRVCETKMCRVKAKIISKATDQTVVNSFSNALLFLHLTVNSKCRIVQYRILNVLSVKTLNRESYLGTFPWAL